MIQRLLVSKPLILQLLRFAAIGVLNTALDFIILNFVSKSLGINSGLQLGTVNVLGFAAAVVQSYYWNKHWTFDAAQTADAVKNFIRLVVVGAIGAAGFLAVIAGAQWNAQPLYYVLVLVIFLIVEVIAWHGFGLGQSGSATGMVASSHQFLAFLVVSVIGLIINSVLVGVLSGYLVTSLAINPDLMKNLAKIVATGASLIWNFVGYKVIVFRK